METYYDAQTKTDAELVALTLENQSFFRFLIERYQEKLSRYIRRISSSSLEEAEDIIQEVFIKVYHNLRDYDPEQKFSSWIYRIAHNQTISEFRKKKSRPQGIDLPDDEDERDLFDRIASNDNIEKEVDIRVTHEIVEEVLKDMDEKYREVLILKYLEERDYQEIAYIMHKPMGTVATLLNRAKKKFIVCAQKKGINLEDE
jgi:RNA polymerase sigma-70 factor (ECF subfamily)